MDMRGTFNYNDIILDLPKSFTFNEYLPHFVYCLDVQNHQKWSQKAGWTRYDAKTGKPTAVECPGEDIFVFDVEILVKEGHYPTLATALSPTNWCVSFILQYLL